MNQSRQYLEMRIQRLETDLAEAQKSMLAERQEKDSMKLKLQEEGLIRDKMDLELGNRKMELERQFLEVENQRALELDNIRGEDANEKRKLATQAAIWEGERAEMLHKSKELNRKLQELEDDLKLF